MANILITEFMENEQIDIMSSKHNVSYEPEIYANSKALLDKSNDIEALIVRNKTNVDKQLLNSMNKLKVICLLYTSPSPRDRQKSRMPSSA